MLILSDHSQFFNKKRWIIGDAISNTEGEIALFFFIVSGYEQW